MFHSAFAGDISNRRLWRVFLCAAAAMLAVCLAHAENITICEEGCSYVNITAGIAAAKPGDTLEVHSGIYRENINVTKPIALLGINTEKGRPVVDASYKGSAIILSADGVKVDGFELRSILTINAVGPLIFLASLSIFCLPATLLLRLGCLISPLVRGKRAIG